MRAPVDAVCLVAKAWDYHVRVALGTTNEENLWACANPSKPWSKPAARR